MKNVVHVDFNSIQKVNRIMDIMVDQFEKEQPEPSDALIAAGLLLVSLAESAGMFKPEHSKEDKTKMLSFFISDVLDSCEKVR